MHIIIRLHLGSAGAKRDAGPSAVGQDRCPHQRVGGRREIQIMDTWDQTSGSSAV